MANIHQKAVGATWYVSYRQNGKQKHRSLGTKNEFEARRLPREIELVLVEKGRIELVVNDRPKEELKDPILDDFWRDFLGWDEAHRAQRTVEEYRNWFQQFREYAGIKLLGDVRKSDVESFKAILLRQGKRKSKGIGLDKVSVNNGLKTLKPIWNHAKNLGLYTSENPFRSIKLKREETNPRVRYLERDEEERLLRALDAREERIRSERKSM